MDKMQILEKEIEEMRIALNRREMELHTLKMAWKVVSKFTKFNIIST